MLTVLQLVDSTAQPVKPARHISKSTNMLCNDLRHVPDQVLPWPEVCRGSPCFQGEPG